MTIKLPRKGLAKQIFDHLRATQSRKITDNHVMFIDHTVPGETYEVFIRKCEAPQQ